MKKRIYFLFILGILISFAIGYILGNSQNPLSKDEFDCLINSHVDGNIIISKNQAICLANKQEVRKFYGIGNPIYFPDDFLRLKLKSNKMIFVKDESNNILTKDNSAEFQNELEKLGVHRVRK